jgi:hypothetical protein
LKHRFLPLCLALSLTAVLLYPQDAETDEADLDQAEFIADEILSDEVFVINAFHFNIKGRTRPDALIRTGEFKEGEEIEGWKNLGRFIQEKTQRLVNQRVLAKAIIDYTLGEIREDGKYPVDLHFTIEDTWNIIAVPYPKYDTNTGFELIVKARDYNFFGTMNPLRIDLGYKYDENGRSSLVFELDSDIPFKAFGYNWNFNFDHAFTYRPNASLPYYYKNITGLSMELPFRTTTFTFGLEETFTLNEENPERYQPDYGEFQRGLYLSSKPYVSWKIPTGLEIGKYGELTYTPELSATVNLGFPNENLDDFRRGPFMSFHHSLGFNRINWIGNYREGLDVSARNSFKYDFYRINRNLNALDIDYSLAGTGHFIINDKLGVSARAQYRHWFYHDPDHNNQAGDALRGVLDKAVHAEYMFSLNLDFPFRVLRFVPSQWFGVSKLRIFDFDMHLSPIVDMAFYGAPASGSPLESTASISFGNNKNALLSGGLEVIVFPAFMRSLYIRGSLAWNFVEQINNPGDYYLNPILPVIPHFPGGNNREIFIGIGHYY